MEHNEAAGCQLSEPTKLCINNCGFFGSAATMNMCSKCHKGHMLKQQQAMLAASSIESIVGVGSSSSAGADVSVKAGDAQVGPVELKAEPAHPSSGGAIPTEEAGGQAKPEGPNRCGACRKRVGLSGFTCRCGDLYCAVHRYSDKHDCTFDYRAVGRDTIAKANPVVKSSKIEKI